MPQWELNDSDYADGWQQRPERQQRDRRQYSTFQTFSGRFVTWPENDPDPDFLIHFVPQNLGLIMALVLPINKCNKTDYNGEVKWHYNPADIVCNESRLGFQGAYNAAAAAIREYMAWRSELALPPPPPKPSTVGAPIWHM